MVKLISLEQEVKEALKVRAFFNHPTEVLEFLKYLKGELKLKTLSFELKNKEITVKGNETEVKKLKNELDSRNLGLQTILIS